MAQTEIWIWATIILNQIKKDDDILDNQYASVINDYNWFSFVF